MQFQAWRVHIQGRNNVANRFNRQGIYISPSSRAFRDEEGKNFWVEIEIIDKYRFPSGSQAPYNVTVRCSSLPWFHFVGENDIYIQKDIQNDVSMAFEKN
mgnify:CR=1 FL=1